MNNSNYCTKCNETLTFHADGSVACSCDLLDSESENIPEHWGLTLAELREARTEEEAHAAQE